MINRLVYIFSLIILFVLLISVYLIMKFTREEHKVNAFMFIDNSCDYIMEIQPSFFLQEGILHPLLSEELEQSDRVFFELEELISPSEPTGISYLSPVYITAKKESEAYAYSILFYINSIEDFNLYAQKLHQNYRTVAARSNQHIGIISYSTLKNQREQLNELEIQLNTPSQHADNFISHFTNTQVNIPIRVFSLINKQIKQELKLSYSKPNNELNINGELNFKLPLINSKIESDPNGFYMAIALTPDLKSMLWPYISAYVSEALFESFSGVEFNYKGVELNKINSTPTPIFDLHVHYNNASDSIIHITDAIQNLPLRINKQGKLVYMDLFKFDIISTSDLISVSNNPFTYRKIQPQVSLALKGNPAVLTKIQEPFGTIARNMEPKLGMMHRFFNGITDISADVTEEDGNILVSHSITYNKSVNPIFEALYLFRNLSVESK